MININMRCIEMPVEQFGFKVKEKININMRCIEIRQNLGRNGWTTRLTLT